MSEAILPLWTHQERAIREVWEAIYAGQRRICLTAPTGAGKSLIIQNIAQANLQLGKQVALYSNRRTLIDQLSEGLLAAGIYHGVRAAGFEDEREHAFQVCSIQTEGSRVLKRGQWEQHACNPGDMAIFDEGHLHTNGKALELRKRHIDGGAVTLDVTATPLSMGRICDVLIQAGTMSELRKCGALVPAHHFGCDEPDIASFKKLRKKESIKEGQDPSERQQSELIMVPGVMGRVWKWYCQINPTQRPTLLFGPGIEGSLWFAEQFEKKGVPAAHIDGGDVWIRGHWYKADQKARNAVRDGSKAGEIKVVCNRFVLREGIDWPWIGHIILAFIAGSVQTYLQTLGRGLRAYPNKEYLTVNDHGGNWWRHGSVNEDRHWELEYTPEMISGLRANKMRQNPNLQPRCCPKCNQIMARRICRCGFEFPLGKPSRPVVTTDGQVRELSGDVFQPRRIARADALSRWERMFWAARKAPIEKWNPTFSALIAYFAQENYWSYPDPAWPFMPVAELDFFRLVKDVPMDRLNQKPVKEENLLPS